MGRLDEIEAELREIEERRTALGKEWQRLKGREFSREMKKLFPNDEITLERVFQVDWNTLGNAGFGQKWWKKITDWLDVQQYGTYNPDTCQNEGPTPLRGVHRDGYNPDTNQVAFTLMLRKGEPLDEQMGLKLLLPHMTPHDGWKRFRIFRHDLSQAGCWSLWVAEDGLTAEVWDDRHKRYSQTDDRGYYKAEFVGPLDEALAYCQDRHYYEWKDNPYKDDEDDW